MKVLHHVADRQGFKIPNDEEAVRAIAKDSNGNLRKALLVFEALKMQTLVSSLPLPQLRLTLRLC